MEKMIGWQKVSHIDVTRCQHCRAEITFLTSKKSGKKYPVNVKEKHFHGQSNASNYHYTYVNDFHKCEVKQEVLKKETKWIIYKNTNSSEYAEPVSKESEANYFKFLVAQGFQWIDKNDGNGVIKIEEML